jgi:hypothetical protein
MTLKGGVSQQGRSANEAVAIWQEVYDKPRFMTLLRHLTDVRLSQTQYMQR